MVKLHKQNWGASVKTSLGFGTVCLATNNKQECQDAGKQFVSQACKGDKCCNGAGGCS